MAQMYQFLAQIAQQIGLLYFFIIFLGVCAYALWPRNRERFEHAANLPLNED